MELADRISVMRDGEIIETRLAGSISETEIVTLIAGRPLGQVFPDKASAPGAPLLETRALSGPGINTVDFFVRSGEIVGLTGVEGEGQREFLRALAGLSERTDGTLIVNGHAQISRTAIGIRGAGVGSSLTTATPKGSSHAVDPREYRHRRTEADSRTGVIDRRAEISVGANIVETLRVRAPSIEAPVADLSGGTSRRF